LRGIILVDVPENQNNKIIDATAKIDISTDKVKAFITLHEPQGGQVLKLSDIIGVLNDSEIVYGIKKDVLSVLENNPVYNQRICIAEGTQPVNGKNGSVRFHFDREKTKKPVILDDGTVDYRNLDMIESVKKEQVLCILIPPVPGVKGMTVTGKEIPAIDGKPARLPRGRNTSIVDDEKLVSNIDGQVLYADGKVNVFSSFEVRSDVDNSTGNIVFVGNVLINGNVLSGFTVEAEGNIEVWGVAEGAVLKAGRDIILKRGMLGHGKGLLISGGDVIAKYIENSTVEAKGNVSAEAVMHSNIKCGGSVELSGKKGLLVGGSCKAGKEITAKTIGSHLAATLTEIEVGTDPEIRENFKKAKEEAVEIEDSIKKTDQAISLLGKYAKMGVLPSDKKQILEKSIKTRQFYFERLNSLKEQIKEFELKITHDSSGKVHCFDSIYPGTRITIGACKLYLKETLQHCTLFRDGADVRTGALEK
jgi:uncharacterized protein